MAAEQRHLQTNPDVIVTEMKDGESVLLNVRTLRYYTLNDTGSSIWKLLVEGSDENSVATTLAKNYEISYSEALLEVRKFVAECEKDRLIVQKAH